MIIRIINGISDIIIDNGRENQEEKKPPTREVIKIHTGQHQKPASEIQAIINKLIKNRNKRKKNPKIKLRKKQGFGFLIYQKFGHKLFGSGLDAGAKIQFSV